MRDRTVIVDGFSKAYAMTGWRLGYAIMPAELAKTVTLFNNNTFSCVDGVRANGGHRRAYRHRRSGAAHERDLPPAPRPFSKRPQRHPRHVVHACPKARSTHFPTSPRSRTTIARSRSTCWKWAAWRAAADRRSARPAKAICVSPTPLRWKTSTGRSNRSRRFYRPSKANFRGRNEHRRSHRRGDRADARRRRARVRYFKRPAIHVSVLAARRVPDGRNLPSAPRAAAATR